MNVTDSLLLEEKMGKRHNHYHLGYIDTAEKMFYVLHSVECRNHLGVSLDKCSYSIAYHHTSPVASTHPKDETFVLAINDKGALIEKKWVCWHNQKIRRGEKCEKGCMVIDGAIHPCQGCPPTCGNCL